MRWTWNYDSSSKFTLMPGREINRLTRSMLSLLIAENLASLASTVIQTCQRNDSASSSIEVLEFDDLIDITMIWRRIESSLININTVKYNSRIFQKSVNSIIVFLLNCERKRRNYSRISFKLLMPLKLMSMPIEVETTSRI